MKYLSLLPLAGLAVAAPGWSDAEPVESTTAAPSTWEDVVTVTTTGTAKATYCPESGKLTKPVDDEKYCTIDVTTIKVPGETATITKGAVTETSTVTKTVGGDKTETVTVTESAKECPTGHPEGPKPGDKCVVDDKKAAEVVANFATLLEYTSYNGTQGAPGRGYKYDVSAATLAEDFIDISDSINFMAGFPLGSVTFPSKKAFDYGQGVLQPEVITETLGVFHDCSSITWRWKLTPKIPGAWPVVGINYFEINEEGLVQKNYAEFNNGAWLQSFGRQCAINPVSKVDGDWAKKM
jgi:hypothetical protein